MDFEDVRLELRKCSEKILELLMHFESATGLSVESVSLDHDSPCITGDATDKTVGVRVKLVINEEAKGSILEPITLSRGRLSQVNRARESQLQDENGGAKD